MVQLGVGKNMVRSIRFWVEVMGIAAPTAGRCFELTPFGRAVLADDGFDPYLEDARTLWLLHWNVATNKDPLFAWQFLLFSWPFGELTRSEALAALRREARRLSASHSDVTLGNSPRRVPSHIYTGEGREGRSPNRPWTVRWPSWNCCTRWVSAVPMVLVGVSRPTLSAVNRSPRSRKRSSSIAWMTTGGAIKKVMRRSLSVM